VLHFIHRYPGMRVADLLEILQITKQSLARVLRELVKDGYVAQRSGKDRRERLLYATAKGRVLARRLAAPQLDKIRDALAQFGAEGQDAVARFLDAMISGAAGQRNAIRTRAAGFGDDRPMGDR
jgi:DNA-binding MarR family transcriptional regulator